MNQDYELGTRAGLSGPEPVWVNWIEDIAAVSCLGLKGIGCDRPLM